MEPGLAAGEGSKPVGSDSSSNFKPSGSLLLTLENLPTSSPPISSSSPFSEAAFRPPSSFPVFLVVLREGLVVVNVSQSWGRMARLSCTQVPPVTCDFSHFISHLFLDTLCFMSGSWTAPDPRVGFTRGTGDVGSRGGERGGESGNGYGGDEERWMRRGEMGWKWR